MDRYPYLGVPHNSLHQGPGQVMKNVTPIRKSCGLQRRSLLTPLNCTPGSPAQPCLKPSVEGHFQGQRPVRPSGSHSPGCLHSTFLSPSQQLGWECKSWPPSEARLSCHSQSPPRPSRASLSLPSLNMFVKTSISESPRKPAISLREFVNLLKFDADICT